jgi:cytochrome c peroxidase
MGIAGHEAEVLGRFSSDGAYLKLFRRAFPGEKNPVSIRNVTYALASFERTLISGHTAYDRWAYGGDTDALTPDERAGAKLFFSRRLGCFQCHAGFNFSGPVDYEGAETPSPHFHNTGLYSEDGQGAYPLPNTGLHRHSGLADDMGRFRAPTLRNIALTAPYMHDGSIPTLEAVIDHYAAGGRAGRIRPGVQGGPPANAVKDPLIRGFTIGKDERGQLVAFLRALTDDAFVRRAVVRSRP